MRKSKISLALLAAMAIQAPITSYAFAEEEIAPEAQTAKEKAEAKEQAIKEDEIEVITVGGMRSSEVAAINMIKLLICR